MQENRSSDPEANPMNLEELEFNEYQKTTP